MAKKNSKIEDKKTKSKSAKKTTPTKSKKPVAKKAANLSSAKVSPKKNSSSPKNKTKSQSLKSNKLPKKDSSKQKMNKKTSPSTSKSQKSNANSQGYIVINKKKVKLPKRIELLSYSCVWRVYVLVNPKTKQTYNKKFWIVIGDGHKRYRKFETQEDAINYFRYLKKYAKMRVQSVGSKEFIRTVYTFFEMVWRGNEIQEIKQTKPKKRKATETIEEHDFEDEFTKFDTDEIDKTSFNEEEINKVLAESEKDVIILSDENHQEAKTYNNKDKYFVTDIITINEKNNNIEEEQKVFVLTSTQELEKEQHQEIKTEEINDPYAITQEFIFEDLAKTDETILESKSLYEMATLDNIQETKVDSYESPTITPSKVNNEVERNDIVIEENKQNTPIANNNYSINNETPQNNPIASFGGNIKVASNPDDEEIELTQYQTSLNSKESLELADGKYHQKRRILFWVVVSLVCLILAVIVVISICVAQGVIKF